MITGSEFKADFSVEIKERRQKAGIQVQLRLADEIPVTANGHNKKKLKKLKKKLTFKVHL